MKIAVFTLTRDRLDYTKRSFKSLKEKAGYPYDHYVIDNGSTDGTQEWLRNNAHEFKAILFNKKNEGISKSCNKFLNLIFGGAGFTLDAETRKQVETTKIPDYDLIIKFDNDCEVISSDILKEIADIYESIPPFFIKFMLSPRVEGLNYQPNRIDQMEIGGHPVGITHIIGGIFQPIPAECYKLYKYKEELPKAKGQDEDINAWFKAMGGQVGYIEDLVIEHMDSTEGQKQKYPEYFKRKTNEEKK